MPTTGRKLTAAVEEYLVELRRIRTSGGGTGEMSYYLPLGNLLNAVGGSLRPRVYCISQLAQQGAGHPDFGLYAARQVQKGQPKQGQTPEAGVVEVKLASDDAWLTADSAQVSRYWELYRLALVTNTRDFVLLGEDSQGNPARDPPAPFRYHLPERRTGDWNRRSAVAQWPWWDGLRPYINGRLHLRPSAGEAPMLEGRKPVVTELALADALDRLVNQIEELRADADLRVAITTDETQMVKLTFSGTPDVGFPLQREVRDIPGAVVRRIWNEGLRDYGIA